VPAYYWVPSVGPQTYWGSADLIPIGSSWSDLAVAIRTSDCEHVPANRTCGARGAHGAPSAPMVIRARDGIHVPSPKYANVAATPPPPFAIQTAWGRCKLSLTRYKPTGHGLLFHDHHTPT
jgi:hypothetical protein